MTDTAEPCTTHDPIIHIATGTMRCLRCDLGLATLNELATLADQVRQLERQVTALEAEVIEERRMRDEDWREHHVAERIAEYQRRAWNTEAALAEYTGEFGP